MHSIFFDRTKCISSKQSLHYSKPSSKKMGKSQLSYHRSTNKPRVGKNRTSLTQKTKNKTRAVPGSLRRISISEQINEQKIQNPIYSLTKTCKRHTLYRALTSEFIILTPYCPFFIIHSISGPYFQTHSSDTKSYQIQFYSIFDQIMGTQILIIFFEGLFYSSQFTTMPLMNAFSLKFEFVNWSDSYRMTE